MNVMGLSIIVLLCTVAGYCYGNSLPHTDSRHLFSIYNKDHNQCLSEAEFTNIFLDFDTWPEDQQISQTEFLAGWRHDALHNINDVPFFFELVDHSSPRDNEISLQEMKSLYASLFDKDGTGCVDSHRFDYVWSSLFAIAKD